MCTSELWKESNIKYSCVVLILCIPNSWWSLNTDFLWLICGFGERSVCHSVQSLTNSRLVTCDFLNSYVCVILNDWLPIVLRITLKLPVLLHCKGYILTIGRMAIFQWYCLFSRESRQLLHWRGVITTKGCLWLLDVRFSQWEWLSRWQRFSCCASAVSRSNWQMRRLCWHYHSQPNSRQLSQNSSVQRLRLAASLWHWQYSV